MKESEKYLLIYAYGSTDSGTKLDGSTIIRITKGLDWVKKQGSDAVRILLGAGKDPNFPKAPALKMLMCNYIVNYSSIVPEIKMVKANAWGTWGETKVVVEYLQSQGITNKTIYVVSHKFHQKRIEYIWSFFGQYKIEFIACDDAYKGSNTLEPLKMLKVFLLGNLYRLKKLFK